jgi:WD40 repeat protein
VLLTVLGFAAVTAAWLDAAEQRRAAEERNEQLTRARDALQKTSKLADERARDANRNSYFGNVAAAHQLWQGNDVAAAQRALDRCPAEFRNWEWYYLQRLCRPELFMFRRHSGNAANVSRVALSPDGRLVASGGQGILGGNTVKIWEAVGGRRLASGSDDRSIRLWEVESGGELFALRGHAEPVVHVTFNGDGRRLAAASGLLIGSAGAVKIWDVSANPEVRTWRGPAGRLSACTALSPAAGRYAMAQAGIVDALLDSNEGVSVHDLKVSRALFRLRRPPKGKDPPSLNAFSPDGRLVAGVSDGLTVFEAASGKPLCTIPLPKQLGAMALVPVAFSSDGRLLAAAWTAYPETKLAFGVWEARTGKPIFQFADPAGKDPAGKQDIPQLPALAFSPDGKELAVTLVLFGAQFPGGGEMKMRIAGELQVWDVAARRRLTVRSCPHGLQGVAFSPDGTLLAAGGGTRSEGRVVAWETKGWREAFQLQGQAGSVNALAFNRDGSRLVTAGDDRLLKLWDTATGQKVLTLRGHTKAVTLVGFTPDGQSILSATGINLNIMNPETIQTMALPMEVKIWEARR